MKRGKSVDFTGYWRRHIDPVARLIRVDTIG
jgi:hypothetical protein